jgi:hypothetical protein
MPPAICKDKAEWWLDSQCAGQVGPSLLLALRHMQPVHLHIDVLQPAAKDQLSAVPCSGIKPS